MYASPEEEYISCVFWKDHPVWVLEGGVPDLSVEGKEGHRRKGITVRATGMSKRMMKV